MSFRPNWEAIERLEGITLQDHVFEVLQQAAQEIQLGETDDPELLSAVPRLADIAQRKPELKGFDQAFSALARSTGLWNYIDKRSADARDLLIAEAATYPGLGEITLHREQLAALNILLSGKNLILSAPTSFGKSILIDALLLSEKYSKIAIVLPTIALLDEFRRRLTARFGNQFDILMHHSDKAEKERVVYLGTQERLLNRDDLGMLDLVVVDEFYKLDPARKDERAITLNAAVYRLLRKTRQFFFLGPNIETVQFAGSSRWRFEFLRTRFSTVAVNTYDLKNVKDKNAKLKEEVSNKKNWPILVFVSSPDKANTTAASLTDIGNPTPASQNLSRWIDSNYGKGWSVAASLKSGIGVHHGRIPRALASIFVRLFNSAEMPILFCTSTLIEGVNTAAKSIIIFDKTIARSSYDFFTFSNIRGRAGRLGQHHVGNVYLFHTPPDEEDVDVSPPLFGDLNSAPDELVVHISDEDSTAEISARVNDLSSQLNVTSEELRRLSGIGFEKLLELKQYVAQAARDRPNRFLLSWDGWPEYKNILAVCEIVCGVQQPRAFGCYSSNQLALYIQRLRSYTTLRNFHLWYANNFRGKPTEFDNVFKFLRACEYSLPEYFSAVEIFLQHMGVSTNYGPFIAQMMSWFRAEALKNLEEEGVPIQISERFLRNKDTAKTLGQRLRRLALAGSDSLSEIERSWILEALPR